MRTARSLDAVLRIIRSKCVFDHETGCMNWTGCCDSHGYAIMSYQCKYTRVSRIIITGRSKKPLTQRDFACHRCDNIKCCNPKHIYLGNAVTNARDAVRRKRSKNSKKTHCFRGHKFTKANIIYIKGAGPGKWRRLCRACHNDDNTKQRLLKKVKTLVIMTHLLGAL